MREVIPPVLLQRVDVICTYLQERIAEEKRRGSSMDWYPPFQTYVSPEQTDVRDGEVCLEWWVGKRKITIWVNTENVMALKVWGIDMDDEMEDFITENLQDPGFWQYWIWLYQPQ